MLQSENAIQTINLTKTFKSRIQDSETGFFRHRAISVKAVDNLNLEIKKGELLGFWDLTEREKQR